MDDYRDPAFLGDAVLASEEDEALEELPQSTLKLLSDFPAPLTEPQRRAVQRHVTRQMRDYDLVRRQVAVVELGYLALLRVVKRLRREHADLQASLVAKEQPEAPAKTSVAPSVITTPTTTPAAASAETSASATKETTAGPKRRPGGLLLRSAVFNGLQRVLQTAKSEQHDEKAEQLARQRERIAKESRLHLLAQDLASQEALLAPLEHKYKRAATFGQEAVDKAAVLLTLLEDMMRLETLYPARFSLHAVGPLEPLMSLGSSSSNHSSGAGGNGADDGQTANEERDYAKQATDTAAAAAKDGTATSGTTSSGVQYVVPFTPAQYTSEIEDRVRAQVEDVIDEYLAYRTRMDPVLYQLEQAQQAAKAERVDQLMDIIGAKNSGSEAGALFMSGGGGGVGQAAEGGLPTNAAVVAAAIAGKSAQSMLNISASDEDEEAMEMAAAEDEAAAADKDRQDREHIRTALTALDDFEDA